MRGGRERGEAAPGIDRVSRGSQGEESGTEHDDGFACGDLARVVPRLRGGRSTTPALGDPGHRWSLQDLYSGILFSIFVAPAAVVNNDASTEVDVVADNSGPP